MPYGMKTAIFSNQWTPSDWSKCIILLYLFRLRQEKKVFELFPAKEKFEMKQGLYLENSIPLLRSENIYDILTSFSDILNLHIDLKWFRRKLFVVLFVQL